MKIYDKSDYEDISEKELLKILSEIKEQRSTKQIFQLTKSQIKNQKSKINYGS
jgi:Ca2+-binding EF-hand superfamily protein